MQLPGDLTRTQTHMLVGNTGGLARGARTNSHHRRGDRAMGLGWEQGMPGANAPLHDRSQWEETQNMGGQLWG